MSITSSSPLAAYCSYGNAYKRFSTKEDTVQSDVERLLSLFGAPEEIREKIQNALNAQETHFPSGFRYESTADQFDPNRVVVFAALPIPQIDGELPPAIEELTVLPAKAGAWRRSA